MCSSDGWDVRGVCRLGRSIWLDLSTSVSCVVHLYVISSVIGFLSSLPWITRCEQRDRYMFFFLFMLIYGLWQATDCSLLYCDGAIWVP